LQSDQRDAFRAAFRVVLKCRLDRAHVGRLETLAALLRVRRRVDDCPKVITDNLAGLEWWYSRLQPTV